MKVALPAQTEYTTVISPSNCAGEDKGIEGELVQIFWVFQLFFKGGLK